MKTLLNSLNRTANKCLFAIIALLLTFGAGNAWADDNWYQHNNESHIYFNDYTTNWVSDPSSDGITFLIGRDYQYNSDPTADVGSQAYRMTHIANTRLWYAHVPSWGTGNGAYYQYIAFRFAAGTTGWDDWQGGWDNRPTGRAQLGSNTKYSCTYNHNITGRNQYYVPQSSDANAAMNAYQPFDNQKVTAYLRVKYDERDGNGYGSIITGDDTWTHGVIMDFTGTYMSSVSTSAQSTIYNLDKNYWMDNSNKTYGFGGIPPTGEVTFELKSIDTGFEIEGWAYSEDATIPAYTDNVTNPTFQVLANTSYVAMIRRKQYTITLNDNGGSGGNGSVTTIYDRTDNLTSNVTCPTKTGYTFQGYYTNPDGTGSMVINASGVWQNSVEGYTGIDNGNPKWIRDESVTLYAHWTPKPYTVTLEGMEADGGSVPVHVDVTYDGVLSQVTPHTKTHYDFAGYWTSDDLGTTLEDQLIDANGNWIKDVAGYTGHSGESPTWVRDNSISLFAKWTEIKHTVAVAVSPAGAGSVQVSGENIAEVTNVGYVTHSPVMTAVPANAAWVFKEWQETSSINLDLEHHSTTSTTMEIMATADEQKITAVFEPRYGLIGSLNEEGDLAGGMPNKNGVTWGTERSADYEADFEVVGFTALGTGDGTGVDLQCTRSLLANKQYKFQVVDRSTIGRDRFCLEENGSAVLEEGNSVTLTNKEKGNANVLINTLGEGNYTFKITNISNDGNYYPTLIVIRPQQVNFGQKYQDVDGVLHEGTIGGSVAVAKTAGGALSSGDWVTYNTSVTHTATATSPGYTFAGWWGSDAFTGDSYSTTNPMTYAVIARDNAYAQFIEIPTTVTLSNDGHGHVEIGGVTVSNTTVGVTTHRELTAVPDEGYKFNSWTKVSGDDITLSSTSENPTTLSGLGAGAASGQEVRANFTYRYSIKGTMNSENWAADHFVANIETIGGKVIGYADIDLPANTSYEFAIYDMTTEGWYKNGSTQVFYMTNGNSHNWTFATDKTWNCGITTAGAGTYRFTWNITDKKMTVTYPNFVIYRTGDKAEDPRAQSSDVETYAGGTIEKAIEYRMKVHTLDEWATLCLPFTVSAVKVWDDEDGAYYDIVPFYRTNDKFYTGHYIIRTPETVTNYAIATFEENWLDPESPTGYLPSANTPYIIQWHDTYFSGKYISFFSPTGQLIPTDFSAGSAPSADDVVNIYGNNTMHSGTVRDAYLLEPDYGPSGAWLREAAVGTDRTVLPFECFIRANEATTTRYRILRRGATPDDTPTGWEVVMDSEPMTAITVYTLTGILVARYDGCSFAETARRLNAEQAGGIYILRSENESVKLMIGGQ